MYTYSHTHTSQITFPALLQSLTLISALSGQDPGVLPDDVSSQIQKRSERTEELAVKRAHAQGVGSVRVHAHGTFARRTAHRDEMKKRITQMNSDGVRPVGNANMRRLSVEIHKQVRLDSVDRKEAADMAERV